MKIRIEGQDFQGFMTATVMRHFLDISGHFTFTTSPLDIQNAGYPIQVQQECQILVADNPFLTGFIEAIDVTVNAGNVTITASGRDKTCDLVDSTVDYLVLSEFSGAVTLKQICETVLTNLNITDIPVIDKVNPAVFEIGDYIAPSTGESGFELLQKYSKKRQVLLTTDGFGNLLITQAVDGIDNPISLDTRLINKFSGQSNNVLSAHYNRNTAQEFRTYKSYSQLATTTLNFANDTGGAGSDVLADNASSQIGEATNTEIRESRQIVFVGDTPLDNETASQRALWELNYRRSRGQSYTCTVQGHTFNNNDDLWEMNRLVQVFDDFADIEGANLLVDSLRFTESVDGERTEIGLVNNLSYSLQVEQNYRQALSESLGNAYFKPST